MPAILLSIRKDEQSIRTLFRESIHKRAVFRKKQFIIRESTVYDMKNTILSGPGEQSRVFL
jgi:hypothetical protein